METMEAASTNNALHTPYGGVNTSHVRSNINDYNSTIRTTDIGLTKNTIFPSIFLNTSLSGLSYLVSYSLDRVEVKDWFWGGNQVANVWWSAIGRRVCESHLSVADAFEQLSWTQKLLLCNVSIWGSRLAYRVASRGFRRHRSGKGNDDPRYLPVKQQPGFWKTAFWTLYLPEVAFQAVIALPFTLPFRGGGTIPPIGGGPSGDASGFTDVVRALGVGLFGAGIALEGIADCQLSNFKGKGLERSGVWSIVRHPNYLGDILIHTSFALISMADSFHPIVILGPLANYAFLRYYGGDKENEASQEARYKQHNELKYNEFEEWRKEKNSVWPSPRELANPWTWAVAGLGVTGVFLEEVVKGWCGYQ